MFNTFKTEHIKGLSVRTVQKAHFILFFTAMQDTKKTSFFFCMHHYMESFLGCVRHRDRERILLQSLDIPWWRRQEWWIDGVGWWDEMGWLDGWMVLPKLIDWSRGCAQTFPPDNTPIQPPPKVSSTLICKMHKIMREIWLGWMRRGEETCANAWHRHTCAWRGEEKGPL